VGSIALWLRNVTYQGKGSFAEVRGGNGTLYVENARLQGSPPAPAILNKGALVLKNVTSNASRK